MISIRTCRTSRHLWAMFKQQICLLQICRLVGSASTKLCYDLASSDASTLVPRRYGMLHCYTKHSFCSKVWLSCNISTSRHGSFLSDLHIFQFWMLPIAPVDMMSIIFMQAWRNQDVCTQCTVRGHFGVFQRVSLCPSWGTSTFWALVTCRCHELSCAQPFRALEVQWWNVGAQESRIQCSW